MEKRRRRKRNPGAKGGSRWTVKEATGVKAVKRKNRGRPRRIGRRALLLKTPDGGRGGKRAAGRNVSGKIKSRLQQNTEERKTEGDPLAGKRKRFNGKGEKGMPRGARGGTGSHCHNKVRGGARKH